MATSTLKIPELVALINQYLDQSTLARCVLVNRLWHSAFIPPLYNRIRYTGSCLHEGRTKDRWIGLQKYSVHTTELTVASGEFPDPEHLVPDCRDLTILRLHPNTFDWNHNLPSYYTRLLTLVQRNPDIRTFEIDPAPWNMIDHLVSGLKILQHLPALSSLTLGDGVFGSEDTFAEILRCCPKLERLSYHTQWSNLSPVIDSRHFDDGNENVHGSDNHENDDYNNETKIHPPMWTRLKSLSLTDQVGSRVMELVERCPRVQNFRASLWDDNVHDAILHKMIQHRSMGVPSYVEHLELSQVMGENAITTVEKFLQLDPETESLTLKSFCLNKAIVSQGMMTSLIRFHAESLEEVVLSRCYSSPGIESSSVAMLLSRCPRLLRLEVALLYEDISGVHMEDLNHDPWVCTDLRILAINIIGRPRDQSDAIPAGGAPVEDIDQVVHGMADVTLDEEEVDLQRQIWRRIGKLTLLHTLRIHTVHSCVSDETRRLLMEHGGLDELCKLTKLKEFQVSRSLLGDDQRHHLIQWLPQLAIVHPNE